MFLPFLDDEEMYLSSCINVCMYLHTVDSILHHLSDVAHGSVDHHGMQGVQSARNLADIVWGNASSYGDVGGGTLVPTEAECLRRQPMTNTVT